MNELSRPREFLGANHKQPLAALHETTDRLHLFEFWGEDAANEHAATEKLRADRIPAVPHIWKYRDIHPCLLEAAELIPMEMSERRSIIMVNPALRPYVATTTTLFAAYRINTPHEMMPPHRHSPNAIRFGLTGATNFTGVHGENITFGPGDLVLTPPRHLAQPRQRPGPSLGQSERARYAASEHLERDLLRVRLSRDGGWQAR